MSNIEINRPAPKTTTVSGNTARNPEIAVKGPPGPIGPAGVYVGDVPPENTDLIWVDTSA